VNTAQTAFFVKGGVIYDRFESGTYTITTANIPLLNKVLNLPFGNESPFKAEVWFINLINKLDCKWGTLTPIQLEDPKYGMVVSIRAYGQYGMKISNPEVFLRTLVGNLASYSTDKVMEYFKGKIISSLTGLIAQKMALENMSVLEINAHLGELSTFCQEQLDFKEFGIDIVNFYFMSINVPDDDPSMVKLKEAKDIATRMKITGKDIYQMDRSFDVMAAAAANEGGGMASMGAGLGAGFGIGGQMGNMFAQHMNTNNPVAPPPIPQAALYFLHLNNQQQGGFDFQTVANLISQQQVTADTLAWKQGMPNWLKINTLPEFINSFGGQTPPPIPVNI
jgi:membrane protease subunit (stomatin/prohibitin family)